MILISSIVGPGVFVALPELFEAAPAAHAANLVLTAWLTFNVVFNLVAATVKSAGECRACDTVDRASDEVDPCINLSILACSVPLALTFTLLCRHCDCSRRLAVSCLQLLSVCPLGSASPLAGGCTGRLQQPQWTADDRRVGSLQCCHCFMWLCVQDPWIGTLLASPGSTAPPTAMTSGRREARFSITASAGCARATSHRTRTTAGV